MSIEFFFNTGNPLGVHTQGFVGVSYPGAALGQRVSEVDDFKIVKKFDFEVLQNQFHAGG